MSGTYEDGWEVATLRAQSRVELGLPIVRESDDQGMLTPEQAERGETLDDRLTPPAEA